VSADVEARLAACLAAGDHHQAVTLALGHYGPEICGFLVATERNEDAGCEIFAQLCEDLWRGIGGFRRESSFRTWAYTLARHAQSRYHRDGFRRRATGLSDPKIAALCDEVRTTTLTHLRSEVREGVARLRDALEADDQALLVLRVDRGMAWRDVARVLDGADDDLERRAAAWRKRYERVKLELRELAEKEGLVRRRA
jgi:RNA polymerase sigma-70 factor, ECF subfamily